MRNQFSTRKKQPKQLLFSIERFALDDGPGIRTLIFFKGCSLKCLWCDNPEGQVPCQELLLYPERCIGCGACVRICPNGASYFNDKGEPTVHRNICRSCGRCSDICFSGARRYCGFSLSVDELYRHIVSDSGFYKRSNGGVTLSGGEPLIAWRFAREILHVCHSRGIHTAVETCGHYPWGHLARCLPYLRLVFYDLKHMNPRQHREITGKDNRLILENAKKLFETDIATVVRVPVVPGLNDDLANIIEIARFLKDYPRVRVQLLPYHPFGVNKYRRLNRPYHLEDLVSPREEQLQQLVKLFRFNNATYLLNPLST